jgi:hypothetical protein
MASQFEKRKVKTAETVAKEIQDKRSEIRASGATEVSEEPVYDQMAYDIYTDNGGKTYKVAEISYNPITKRAEVKELFSITRLVALQYANTKTALGTLKRKAIKLKE